jgi:MFS family permease
VAALTFKAREMAFSARYPIWLPTAPRPTAAAFTLLFVIESLARASVATVIALQAYDILQSGQKVSQVYTLVAVGSLLGTLLIPLLIQKTARRFIYSFGGLALILAALALASYTLEGQVAGMFLRVFGSACLNVTTSLYILDHIRKTDYVRVEPLRMTFATFSWTIGPSLGVWLYTTYGVWAPHAFTAVCSVVLLAVFWYLRLSDNTAIRPGKVKPTNPLRNIHRFVKQPRLRLAWMIAFGRSCFWVTFFVYAPILMVESGLGKQAGGFLISAGNAMLITAFLFGKFAQRVGVRKVIALAFLAMAGFTASAGLVGVNHPYITAALLLGGSLAATAIDGVGSIPFLRAVHSHERAEMTGVYRTYLDLSELLPTALFSIVLLYAPLSAVFLLLGGWAMICGFVAWRYLPARL